MVSNTKSLPTPPIQFVCPLTKELMQDVVVSRYGNRFERSAILNWINSGNNYCPITGNPLRPSNLVSDKKHQWEIQYWASKNGYTEYMKKVKQNGQEESKADDAGATAAAASSVADTGGEILRSIGSVATVAVPPNHFICPLTKEIMKEPMISKTGITYERKAILDHLNSPKGDDTCPVTKKPLLPSGLIPNKKLEWEIQQWQLNYGPNGYEEMSKLELESKLSKAEMISRDFQLSDILKALVVDEASAAGTVGHVTGGDGDLKAPANDDILDVLDDVVNTIDDI